MSTADLLEGFRDVRCALEKMTERIMRWGAHRLTAFPGKDGDSLWGLTTSDLAVGASRSGVTRGGSLPATEPSMVLLSLSHDTPEAVADTLEIQVLVRWTTGGGTHTAEVDVPAGGVCVALAGADFESVTWEATGDSATRIAEVTSTLSIVGDGYPRPVQRTVALTFPAQSGVVVPIPKWARQLRLSVSDNTGLPGAGDLIEMFSDSAGAVTIAAYLLATAPLSVAVFPVPLGARFFSVTIADATARRVNAMWELSL